MGQGVLLSAGADIDFMVHGVFSYEIFGKPHGLPQHIFVY